MTLETILLVLESVLLAFTVLLLVMSIREGRKRDELINKVSSAVRVLSRHEYFISVVDSMMDAKHEVVGCITGRIPTGEDTKRTRELIINIEKLAKSGIKVRYLLPKFQDRLHIGWQYSGAGAEVRYSACATSHDFRYIAVDGKAVVIGIPASVGEREATRQGYKIPSEGLAGIMSQYFDDCWEDSIPYEEYLKETIIHTGADPKTLARELEIDEKELIRVSGK
jgi:hypothetical protein